MSDTFGWKWVDQGHLRYLPIYNALHNKPEHDWLCPNPKYSRRHRITLAPTSLQRCIDSDSLIRLVLPSFF